jgi:SnoaL-like domain
MSEIETVRDLNSIFERYEFTAWRDAMEESSADAISSGILELDQLVRSSISDDVVVQFHGELALPEGDRYEGLEGYLRFFRGWLAAFDEYALEHGNYEQVGDSVVVDVVHRGRGRGSGLEVELAQVQRWVVRDGKASEIHVYVSREEALAATE